jgi:hypothetical protein
VRWPTGRPREERPMYDPDDGVLIKEEPDCAGCNDCGYRWNGRRCGCNPGRVGRLLAPIRMRWWLLMHRRQGWRQSDVPPF